MKLTGWEHLLSRVEINYSPNGKAFKYLAFGTTVCGQIHLYGQGMTDQEAVDRLLRRAIDRDREK